MFLSTEPSTWLEEDPIDGQLIALLQVLACAFEPITINQFQRLLLYVNQAGILPNCPTGFDSSVKQPLLAKKTIRITEKGIEIEASFANNALDRLSDIEFKRLTLALKDAENDGLIEKSSQRDAYLSLRSGNSQEITTLFPVTKDPQLIENSLLSILNLHFFQPFELEKVLRLPAHIQYQTFVSRFDFLLNHSLSITSTLQLANQVLAHNPNNTPLRLLVAQYTLFQGEPELSKALIKECSESAWRLQIDGFCWFLQSDFLKAIECYQKALIAKQRYRRKKHPFFDGLLLLGYLFSLIALRSQAEKNSSLLLAQMVENLRQNRQQASNMLYPALLLDAVNKYLDNDATFDSSKISVFVPGQQDHFHSALMKLVTELGIAWTDQPTKVDFIGLKKIADHFEVLGLTLIADWARNQDVPLSLFRLVQSKSSWEKALDRLVALNSDNHEPELNLNQAKRLIWQLTPQRFAIALTPWLQVNDGKKWLTESPIELQKLKEQPHLFDFLTNRDKKVLKHVAKSPSSLKSDYLLEGLKPLRELVGSTLVTMSENLETVTEFKSTKVKLEVKQHQSAIEIALNPKPHYALGKEVYAVQLAADGTIQLFEFLEPDLNVLSIVSEHGLFIPNEHKHKAVDAIQALFNLMPIDSELDVFAIPRKEVAPESTLIIRIRPYRQGLGFQCTVMPLGEHGPRLVPGIGGSFLSAQIGMQTITTTRDLSEEQRRLEYLDEYCPAFLEMDNNQLVQGELQSALETLEQLYTVITKKPSWLKLEWQKGHRIELAQPLQAHHLQLGLYKKNEWFDLVGELRIDEQQVIALRPLLGLINLHKGRFIPMDDGTIVSLSQSLYEKLANLNSLTDNGRFSPLAARQILDSTTGLRMQTAPGWERLKAKLIEAQHLEVVIPAQLKGSLRPYQHQGVEWAMRLAHWGAGACLADDMGLGKTLQAIAVIVSRASLGPSMVVAPTSVCANWQSEFLRFAPSLKIVNLGHIHSAEARMDRLNHLQPFDCILVSYSLMQRLENELQSIHWQTIVADEAQFLKNPLSGRSKSAYRFKSGFKMALTGTPIENNLTELWSIFRFINPGLLGNLKVFNQRFNVPIEKANDDPVAAKKAREGLKYLLSPFLLRRTKEQVLKSLPHKTEINLDVQLSQAELAFYESVRLSAIETLSETAQLKNAGERQLRMLAELVKLRQACCAPQLLVESSEIESSKINLLLELLEGLKVNGHKVLIFSQFVAFLQLIKAQLIKHNYRFNYLDGSTPVNVRKTQIDAFQRGDSDVFLISLKAGGFGLNLTAASYVIHMDPWWNPAVENQASDRVHRIGQEKPVTIYRLVANQTIEARIVDLHAKKQALADQLLQEGNEQTLPDIKEILTMLSAVF
ncbi:hypothetical protein PALB_28210 [Pseudoalteromonas luteoviolacea B = ATCC 29581]|nr:hypothetical protein PALB_28210 [Pseudoalteromonas luteoviolacea B = ATCC 29581]